MAPPPSRRVLHCVTRGPINLARSRRRVDGWMDGAGGRDMLYVPIAIESYLHDFEEEQKLESSFLLITANLALALSASASVQLINDSRHRWTLED